MTTPIKVVVCCDADCVNYNVAQEVALTADEIAANEAAAAQAEADRLVKDAADAAAATAKAGAVSKLKALGLTDSEIAAFNA